MPNQVVTGAILACPFGAAPSSLTAIPKMVTCSGPDAANIMDFAPIMNIAPFGMCICPGNPMFIAATAAALGTPTPVPCIPMTVSPWTPGSAMTTIAGMPALNDTSICNCMWGGVITITFAGQVETTVT